MWILTTYEAILGNFDPFGPNQISAFLISVNKTKISFYYFKLYSGSITCWIKKYDDGKKCIFQFRTWKCWNNDYLLIFYTIFDATMTGLTLFLTHLMENFNLDMLQYAWKIYRFIKKSFSCQFTLHFMTLVQLIM